MKLADPLETQPERPDSLARQVHDILSEMLLSGRLRPDDRMSMRELAERLGVSVMPIREAVSRLVAAGASMDAVTLATCDCRWLNSSVSAKTSAATTRMPPQSLSRMDQVMMSPLPPAALPAGEP